MDDGPRHDQIARTLRQKILGGRYRAGDRLPGERELAERHGVHRSSIREALRTLESLGLISIRRGGGATVRSLEEANLEIVRHLLFVDGRLNRAALEQVLEVHEMLILGAMRLAVDQASDDDRLRATELLTRLADPGTSDDDYIDTIEAVLQLVIDAADNLVLALARRAVNPLFEGPYRDARKRMRAAPEVIGPIAKEVSDAVRDRDGLRAQESVRQLLRLNRERAIEALAQRFEDDRAPHDEEIDDGQ